MARTAIDKVLAEARELSRSDLLVLVHTLQQSIVAKPVSKPRMTWAKARGLAKADAEADIQDWIKAERRDADKRREIA